MTTEAIKDTISNYRFYLGELKGLSEALEKSGGTDWMPGIGLSSKEERMMQRFELHQRRLELIDEAMGNADLTEIEWASVFWVMEGMSIRQAAKKIFGMSDTNLRRVFNSAISKMKYFIENGHVR